VGYGLDLVDAKNSQVGLESVKLEKRIMIAAEVARRTGVVHGGVEHPADLRPIDDASVYAEANSAAGKLIHDDHHPMAL